MAPPQTPTNWMSSLLFPSPEAMNILEDSGRRYSSIDNQHYLKQRTQRHSLPSQFHYKKANGIDKDQDIQFSFPSQSSSTVKAELMKGKISPLDCNNGISYQQRTSPIRECSEEGNSSANSKEANPFKGMLSVGCQDEEPPRRRKSGLYLLKMNRFKNADSNNSGNHSTWLDSAPNQEVLPVVAEPQEPVDGEKTIEDDEEMEIISRKLADISTLVRQHLLHVENRLFEMFGDKERQTININKFLMGLTATGMRHADPRLKEMRKNLKMVQDRLAASVPQALDVNYETFMSIISDNLEIVVKALSSSFVIPDFRGFCHHINEIYNNCLSNNSGKVASYIPQLARSNPDHWAVCVCTVDGQRHSLGDHGVPFTLQSCSKPLNYAMAVGMYGTDHIHSYMGMEPSGRYFNELCLDYNNKPHNPMINAGAIMIAALMKPDLSAADRFDYVFHMYQRLAGGEYLGFNNAVFLSEREHADRNFALAYFMRENKCFPEGTKLHETLDFYFQLCSLELTAESGSVMAATLANGGINPLTGDPVLTVEAVRNTLTLMHSCGMYNYSGQFAFKVGLPSKSGVSGCILLVIPNIMGICLWSPPLDINGNSCRGVQFCMELVSRFAFHNFDNLRGHITTKIDPRTVKSESTAQILFDLLFSAAAGDLSALRRHSLSGTDMEARDYDGRTALHVATSEGHIEIIEFLLYKCHVDPLPKDRWDRTPLDDAKSFGHPTCGAFITEYCNARGINIPQPISDGNKEYILNGSDTEK